LSPRRRRQRAATFGFLATLATGATACTYDFEQYVTPRGGGSAGHPSSAGGAGRAVGAAGGAASGGATNGRAGSGAGGMNGGSNHTDAGDGGATDDAGTGANPDGGGSGGHAGTAAGGAGAGGHAGAGAPGAGTAGGGTAGSAPVDCTDGSTYGGHCYFLASTSGGLAWESAKSACAAHDGHLVTITSSGEQTFLAATFFPASDDAWIGLSLEDTQSDPSSLCALLPDRCPFVWLTGETLVYDAWTLRSGDDEPNYTGACVRLTAADQSWADTDCASAFRAICERDG
jgi:hypothetical protein